MSDSFQLMFAATLLLTVSLALMSGLAQRKGWAVEPDRPMTYSRIILLPEVYLFLPFLIALIWIGVAA